MLRERVIMDKETLEEYIFRYIDKVKILVSPETWQNLLLDCTKDEIFILLFLYRKGEVNMSMIADYIHVPLNTATGIVGRMEMKKLVERYHGKDDKRIVKVQVTGEGTRYIGNILKEIMRYVSVIMESLSPEEIQTLFQTVNKITDALAEAGQKEQDAEVKVKKIMIE